MHRLGQEDQNNFLTDQMSRFWLTSGVRAPGSAQKRHLEALEWCRSISAGSERKGVLLFSLFHISHPTIIA